ncbi:ABC transporter substrate-binding protein [Pseudarthrobacter sp. YS3]|uniref:ABC transporter substrate-binding protein n=1 Tax=Pseudarthrobacter sp. YS3 TaxID=3453718 RepID=UPI003EE8DA80
MAKGMNVDRRQFMRLSGIGIIGIAAVPTLAACATASAGETTLKIGAFFPVSGPLALLGEESWRGVQIATDLRNAAGGVAGRKIELKFADIPDVNAATSESRRLASSPDVKLAIGSYSSALSLAASEVFARGGRSFVELGAVSEEITARGYENVYRFNPSAGDFTKMQMRFISEYLSEKLGKPVSNLKVILAHEDSAYGQSVAENAKKDAATAGLVNFSTEPYNAKSTDLSSTVLRMKDKSPDIVMAVSYAADAVLLGRQIRDNGLKLGAFIGTGGGHSLKSFHEALGDAADGIFDVDFTQIYVNEKFTPGIQDFTSKYKERYQGLPASGHALANFTGANLLFDLLEKSGGKDDPAEFRKAATSFKLDKGKTAAGWGFELNDKNQNERSDVYIMQWKGTKLETVWPPEAAVREPEIVTPFGV